ncbi:hypothetical protein [Paraburkholderia hayleyella]|uniref:hypothetical protein n=1 Tax=Paraburkholderia hayleyella TaxID=2152889 RepID=UPI001292348A|nr:hypothetical protein [Paraburkholderia hayleyella]
MFKAYSNDDVLNLQGDALTVSNSAAQVEIAGTLALKRDKRSLKAALALHQALGSVIAALQAQADLPEHSADEPPAAPHVIDNPFQR